MWDTKYVKYLVYMEIIKFCAVLRVDSCESELSYNTAVIRIKMNDYILPM